MHLKPLLTCSDTAYNGDKGFCALRQGSENLRKTSTLQQNSLQSQEPVPYAGLEAAITQLPVSISHLINCQMTPSHIARIAPYFLPLELYQHNRILVKILQFIDMAS